MNACCHARPMHAQLENSCRGSGTAVAGQLRGRLDLDSAEVKSQLWDMSEPQLDRAFGEAHLDPTLVHMLRTSVGSPDCANLWVPGPGKSVAPRAGANLWVSQLGSLECTISLPALFEGFP